MRLRNRDVRSLADTDRGSIDARERIVRSRLKRSIRSAVRSLVLDVDDAFALALIGIGSWTELVEILDSKFPEGLDWTDPDAFHIDHVVPVSAFDTTSLFQLHACFYHENLRPVHWRENLVKGKRVCSATKRAYLHRIGAQWARKFAHVK